MHPIHNPVFSRCTANITICKEICVPIVSSIWSPKNFNNTKSLYAQIRKGLRAQSKGRTHFDRTKTQKGGSMIVMWTRCELHGNRRWTCGNHVILTWIRCQQAFEPHFSTCSQMLYDCAHFSCCSSILCKEESVSRSSCVTDPTMLNGNHGGSENYRH